MPIPEINTVDRLRAILTTTAKTLEILTTIHQVDSDGKQYDLKLEPNIWNVVNGRPGMLLFTIPHPLGRKGLWMAAFYVAAGSRYTGSSLNEKRIVTVMEGSITCNGQNYGPGDSMSIAPGLRTTWNTPEGASGVTLYELTEEVVIETEQPADCSVTPDPYPPTKD